MKIRNLVAGQVLVREGDPSGAMYVICAGSVRVYRRDLTAIDRELDVASLGAGAVIGELGPILGQQRSATVRAVEPTRVLEIPADHLPRLVQQHRPLLRVIATALRERTDLPDGEIAELAAKAGIILPLEQAADVQTESEPSDGLPVPDHDPTLVYPRAVTCPSCATGFSALTVHVRQDQPAERSSDFHNTYRSSFNPYDYEVWVCPIDLYAALPADFAELTDSHRLQVAPVVEKAVAEWGDDVPEFHADRTIELRQRSLELALALYTMREMPRVRLAAITHRLAWCARECADVEREKTWLVRSLEHYTTAYSEADLGGAKEEIRIQYLCGELSLRLGDVNGAVGWFAQALRHPALKEHAAWERMLREQWAVAREKSTTDIVTS